MDERLSLLHAARDMSRLPLIANVSATCLDDMARLSDTAYSEGYDAVMVLPHYYFAQTQRQPEALFRHAGRPVRGGMADSQLSGAYGCDVDAALVAKLAARFSRFMGIKDTVDCASHTRAIVRAVADVRPDFSVLCGFDEYFIPNLMNGGDGVLSGLNNVVPELFMGAKKAFRDGDLAGVAAAHKEIGRLSAIYAIGDDFVTTIKTAVSLKSGGLEPVSRGYGGKLDDAQIGEVKRLFSL